MNSWREALSRYLRLSAHATEDIIDSARRRLSTKLNRDRPRCICAYAGYATKERALFSGRVLANKPLADLGDNESTWRNLLNTYRRFETDEVPHVPVTVRFEGHEEVVMTDDEGYYDAKLPRPSGDAESLWLEAQARCDAGGEIITATHAIVAPDAGAQFGVISDLDDTVIETNITSILTAAKLTFIGNAKTRKPLEGVAALYESFVNGNAGRVVNPIFYISSSPWNLYDLLRDFIELNEIPRGPIFLRDIGLDQTKFIKRSGHREKLERALAIMDDFPALSFVLVGDSGQHDAGLYAEAAAVHPDRIKAIYIRDVDPTTASERDNHVRDYIQQTAALGIPMLLAPDSRAIAQHAAEIGLIPPRQEAQIETETARDHERPDPGAQAIKKALDVAHDGNA